MNITVSVRLQYLNVTPGNNWPCSATQPHEILICSHSQLLASLRNGGTSFQKIRQILSSSSIPSLRNTLCLAGILLTPHDSRLVTGPCKHLQPCIIDALSCAGPVIHSDTNLHKIYICHRQLLLMGTDLICGRHQLSHQIHHIFFPLSQKIDSTSSPVIGEGVNVPVLLWPNGVPQVMYRNPSPVLAWSHAIHSWCWSVSRRADIIMTDCYTNNVSVTSFCHQDSLRASSFCRMIVRPRCTKIIMSASSYRVQRANSSKPIMWLLLKSSFDINDHILSLFLRKMRQLDRILHLFDTLHLTNVLA